MDKNMFYQTTGIELKSVRRNYVRKTTQIDRYIGTAFMVLTAVTVFVAVLRAVIHV